MLGLARRDVMPADASVVGPDHDGVRGIFRAVAADDGVEAHPRAGDGAQLPHHPCARQRSNGHQRQALVCAVVDRRQYAV